VCILLELLLRLTTVTLLPGLFQSDLDKVNDLSQKFERFKQQFDRGLLVQSGATIEKSGATLQILLQNMSAFFVHIHLMSIVTI
jgi:hypothetical protein